MKTKHYVFLSFLLLTTLSCTVDVPDEIPDSQELQFSFTVEGDGFSHTFTESDDFESFQLNIKQNMDYSFTFSGSDNENLKNLIWTFPGNLNDYRTTLTLPELPNGWRSTSRYEAPEYIDGLRFDGNQENPTTSVNLSGEFRSYSSLGYYYFDFQVRDYASMDEEENVINKRLRINFVEDDQPTELVPVN